MVTALLVFAFASQAQAKPGRVAFRFQPPASTTCFETQHTTRIEERGSKGKETTLSEDKYQTTYSASETGYTMTIRKIDSQITHEGKSVPNPINEKLKGLALVHALDREGNIQSIQGQDALIEQIKAGLPPEKAAAIDKLFNTQALTQRARLAWHSRLARLAGQSLARKEVLITQEALPLPTGHMAVYFIASRFVDEVPCAASRCVKLQLILDSNAALLNKRLGKASLKEVPPNPLIAGLPIMEKAEITGSGEQVIDPATMLLYSEQINRAISYPASPLPDEVLRRRFEEDQKTSFDYSVGEKKT